MPLFAAGAMLYLFLVYEDQVRLAAEVLDAGRAALREGGYLLAAAQLQSDSAAAVHVQDGRPAFRVEPLDGEQRRLRELFLIRAHDLNEAVRVASGMPQARPRAGGYMAAGLAG